MVTVLIPMAEGFEEIEAIAVIDVLRRGDINVMVYGVGQTEVKGAHGVVIKCDGLVESVSADMIDMIVLPGGGGGTHILATDAKVQSLLQAMDAKGKAIGAICAAPLALKAAGVLKENYTCYPGTDKKIAAGRFHPDQSVVEDGNVMTSRGPGTAVCFGLAIVRKLQGDAVYRKVKSALLADCC